MNTSAIITARYNSERLPGKVLLDIEGKPMLRHVYDSARASLSSAVIATTAMSQPIIDYCDREGMTYYIGDEEDILDRLYQSATQFEADMVVRLWGDSPLISPHDIDYAISQQNKTQVIYYTYKTPFGCISVMPYSFLKYCWHNVTNPDDRHWIHNHMSKFGETAGNDPIFTVDTQRDLDKVREIVRHQSDKPS